MKKVLIASTALALSAGAALADGVTFSGYGRFGLQYNDNRALVGGVKQRETQFAGRLRINIDATKETDSGVKFGGRVRLQWDQGKTGATLNSAYMYVSYEGLQVQVGNANTAYDSAGLLYAPEIGFLDSSFGDPQGAFFAYSSNPYSASQANRVGIFVQYAMGDFVGRVSYVTPDQTFDDLPSGMEDEWSLSADYSVNDFAISAAAVFNGAGIKDNDEYFIGAAYSGFADATVGVNYMDEDDFGNTVVLYGNYTFGDWTIAGYVSNNDADANKTDTGAGIGASYDLGGARISGSVQTGYMKETVADLGVRFDF